MAGSGFLSDNPQCGQWRFLSETGQPMMDGSKSMAKAQEKQVPISIDETADGSRPVVLRPENNDVFVSTGKQVIAACSLGISLDLWLNEMASMVRFVSEWTEKHQDSVAACFVEPRPRCTMLFFVPKSSHFDFDLADELVQLNAQVVKDFNVGMVETHQIPRDELDRFLNPEMSKQIYGEQQQPHHPVEI
jgi:hypothetical protein